MFIHNVTCRQTGMLGMACSVCLLACLCVCVFVCVCVVCGCVNVIIY